ncbi:MAG TPA: RDD family protein [Mycobacteriales bacterium]|nr:RDD family protein [Mycobacteriales bacterium]
MTSGIDVPRGRRLGLPAEGPGSLAPLGPRVGAYAVDVLLSALVAGLLTAPDLPRNWSLVVFFGSYTFFTATFGQTPGMRLCGLALTRVDGGPRVGLWRVGFPRAVLRTFALLLVVPALIWDADRRGLHDRITGTAVVRA